MTKPSKTCDYTIQIEQFLEELESLRTRGQTQAERHLYIPEGYHDPDDDRIGIYYLDQAWEWLITFLENTGQQYLLAKAKSDFAEYKKNPLASEMGLDEPYLIWPSRLCLYHELLKTLFVPRPREHGKGNAEFKDLLKILKKCERYLSNPRLFAWAPCREADVHDRIEELLGCYYNRLARKPRINKPITGFDADTGLPEIKTLIEYKYVDSRDTSKRVIQELLADIGGYQSKTYDRFVFVVYETQRFNRDDEWRDAIDSANPNNTVEVVLLKGVRPSEHDRAMAEEHRGRQDEVAKKRRTKRSARKAAPKTTKESAKKSATRAARRE